MHVVAGAALRMHNVAQMARRLARLAIGIAAAGLLVGVSAPSTVQAFTLIQPVVKLYVNPSAGYTTSLVQVRGTMTFPGGNPCTATAVTFAFTFDAKALWSKTVAACNTTTKLWDTSWSPYKVPPVPRTVGTHHISVTALTVTATYGYVIYAAPSPRASPTPSPSPSPSPSICPITGGLPSTGAGGFVDNLIAGSMVATVLPIIGLALFGPARALSVVGRRRRLFKVLGISLLMVATLGCTSTAGTQEQSQSPVAAVSPSAAASPSSSPSPSPTC